ncbi:hydrophobic protein [Streptomyces sp. NPDC002795]|uniref:hydrophobic protein n=1 Tax=Streptomyces sp. NPDC002795 TaxID=3364665 RepID=UPI0036B37C05
MLFWLLLLLLILVIFGFGFTIQLLWYVAAVLLVVWIVGFVRRGRGNGSRSGRGRRFSRSRG